ncbi:MAG: dihydroorotate dehydrogenase [Candidatus Odinarchaeia archaeon]
MNRLHTRIGNIKLDNPIILASGILGTTAHSMELLYKKGVSAVVTKSTSLNPRMGDANPTVVSSPSGLLNAMGLPNPGIEEMKNEILPLIKKKIPIIGSVTGYTTDEFIKVALEFEKAGVIAVELNISCPHEKVSQIGQHPQLTYQIVKKIRSEVNLPIIVKLTPNVTDITEIAVEAEKAGADAITAINTIKAMAIDIETGVPILSNKIGGLSGPAIKPIAVRCVYEIYEKVSIPIIGVGGISNWSDVIEFIMAGASAVQIGTALLNGYEIIENIKNGLLNYLERKNIKTLEELIGYAHKT